MLLEKFALSAGRRGEAAARQARHDLAQDRGVILGLSLPLGTLDLKLHRIEANIRPENHASRRVVEKLGFREEGMRRRHLHIDGAWRDHLCYAVTIEDAPGGLLPRWRSARSAPRAR